MFRKIFKKKKNLINVMIYKEIIDCSSFYTIRNFVTDERKIVMKGKRCDESRRKRN